ncbi:MAG: hypothetical protein Kow0029_26380 [Candidatus Rifleibacteriota bacterium]
MFKCKEQNSKRGMAIVVVIFFSFALMIMFASMFFQHRSVAGRNKLSLREQQAYFAARAAMQHFLLKARLFPTELYDAVEFKQGKNPYMDFTEFPFRNEKSGSPCFAQIPTYSGVYKRIDPPETDSSGRIRYFYLPIKEKDGEPEVLIRMASFYNPFYRYLAPNLAPADPALKYIQPNNDANAAYNPGKFVTYFIRDCTNDLVDGKILQPALETKKAKGLETEQSWGINDEGYPYTMLYRVKSIDIKAIQGLRRYNEEAIEIVCEGSVLDFQDQPASKEIDQIKKITRTGQHLLDS